MMMVIVFVIGNGWSALSNENASRVSGSTPDDDVCIRYWIEIFWIERLDKSVSRPLDGGVERSMSGPLLKSRSSRLVKIDLERIVQLLLLAILSQKLETEANCLDGRGINGQRQKVRTGHARAIDFLRLADQRSVGLLTDIRLAVVCLEVFGAESDARILVVSVHLASVVCEESKVLGERGMLLC